MKMKITNLFTIASRRTKRLMLDRPGYGWPGILCRNLFGGGGRYRGLVGHGGVFRGGVRWGGGLIVFEGRGVGDVDAGVSHFAVVLYEKKIVINQSSLFDIIINSS